MSNERPAPELSAREKQLLKFAAEGFTDSAIATKLEISEATVATYWGRIRIKLGPYSRTELVAIVLRSEQEAAVEALRRENEELIKKLADTTESSLYKDLIENAPDAMILVSASGTIESVNAAAGELFGYEAGELDGKDLTTLVPDRFKERHREHRKEYVAEPHRREMGEHLETPALRKDGSEFLVRAVLSAMESPTGLIVMCAIRPAR